MTIENQIRYKSKGYFGVEDGKWDWRLFFNMCFCFCEDNFLSSKNAKTFKFENFVIIYNNVLLITYHLLIILLITCHTCMSHKLLTFGTCYVLNITCNLQCYQWLYPHVWMTHMCVCVCVCVCVWYQNINHTSQ
jgi:hypothetical protein